MISFRFLTQFPRSSVMLTLCVITPKDPTTARAKMDSTEMENNALVTVYFIVHSIILLNFDWSRQETGREQYN